MYNRERDTAEKAIAGRKLYLDLNRNGKLDAGEPTTLTAADGSYHFGKLFAGKYLVRQVLPTGWRGTAPTAGDFDVTLIARQTLVGEVFAETQAAVVSGVVFKDTNSNGKQDAGELSVLTDSKGDYSFVVPAGKYNIREVLKAGFKRITPTGAYAIALTAGQVSAGKDFANH